jgi:hypothetical protein
MENSVRKRVASMWIVDVDIWRFRAVGVGHQATDNARSFPQPSDPAKRIVATLGRECGSRIQ